MIKSGLLFCKQKPGKEDYTTKAFMISSTFNIQFDRCELKKQVKDYVNQYLNVNSRS